MPSAAVEQAFRSKIASDWVSAAHVAIGVNGVTEPPSDQTVQSFLVTQYPVVNGEKPVIRGKYFEEGAARLVLNVRSGLDPQTFLPWADTLATLFREYKPGGGFETFTPSPPIINDANDDGNWFELAVIVPYRFQFS